MTMRHLEKTINNNQSWELIAMESTIAGDGGLQSFRTPQSPTVWHTGVWNQNQYGIRHGGEGFWIYDNGDTTIGGHLDVSVSNARTSIKAYGTMDGYTAHTELEAQWNTQGYLNFEPKYS